MKTILEYTAFIDDTIVDDVLFEAIKKNNICVIALCLRYGNPIDFSSPRGYLYLHYCINNDNASLLRSFFSRGLDLNKLVDKKCSPLFLALTNRKINCAIEMINNNAPLKWPIDIYSICEKCNRCSVHSKHADILEEDIEYIDGIDWIIREYVPEFKNALELMVTKIDRFDLDERRYNDLYNLIKNGFIEEIDIIFNRFPMIVNTVYDGNTLLMSLINMTLPTEENKKIIDKYIKLPTTTILINSQESYIHAFARKFDIESMRYLLEKHPNSIKKISSEKKSLIDSVLAE